MELKSICSNVLQLRFESKLNLFKIDFDHFLKLRIEIKLNQFRIDSNQISFFFCLIYGFFES